MKTRYSFINRLYYQSENTGKGKVEEYIFIDFIGQQPLYVLWSSLHDSSVIPEYDLFETLENMHEAEFKESCKQIKTHDGFRLVAQTWDLVVVKDNSIIEVRKGGNAKHEEFQLP